MSTVSRTDRDCPLVLECDSMGDNGETQRSPLAEWTAAAGKSEVLNDVEAEKQKKDPKGRRWDPQSDFGFNVKHAITVPLQHEEMSWTLRRPEDYKGQPAAGVYGVLQLLNKVDGDRFTPTDLFVAEQAPVTELPSHHTQLNAISGRSRGISRQRSTAASSLRRRKPTSTSLKACARCRWR